jgi:hypothetical protein
MVYAIYILSVWPFFVGVAAVFVPEMLGRLVLDTDDGITALELKKRGRKSTETS